MTIGHPLWWSLALLSSGITLGYYYPSVWYLPVAILLLLTATINAAVRKDNGWLLLLFWFALGAIQSSMENILHTPSLPTTWEVIQDKANKQRDKLEKRLQKSGLQEESLSLGSAVLLGKREGITREMRQAYSESGAAHLLALSGLHLGILYGLLHLLIIRRIRYSPWRWFALPPLLLLLWGYVILTGIPISLVRAAIMCTVVMIATLSQRATESSHALALSGIGILLVSPSSLLSISFQLSFMAVLFILIFCSSPRTKTNLRTRIQQSIIVSAAAWLGTAPLTAYYFHTIPLLSIPLSLFLIPITTIIVYLSAVTLLLPVPILGTCLSTLITFQNKVVTYCAGIPGATLGTLHPKVCHIVLVYALLLMVIIRMNGRRPSWEQ
ncbi:MAG: ComEC/Rec2 family competence protein [Bacteroidaceae bacterium]